MKGMPWFAFYPTDWISSVKLSSCSLSARGVMMHILCLMHECEERGRLSMGGVPIPDAKIASMISGDRDEIMNGLRELLEGGALQRDEDGCVICRRMVEDEQKRQAASDAGRRGGNPTLKGTLKATHKRASDSVSSSDSSSKGEECREGEGAELKRQAAHLVDAYPKKVGRFRGLQAAEAAILKERKIRPDAFPYLEGRTKAYAQSWAGNQGRFTPNPETWFGEGRYNEHEREWTKSEPGRSGETKEHVIGKIRTVLRVRSAGVNRAVL